MLKTRHILLIFIPSIFIVAFAFFIRVVQYQPLNNQDKDDDKGNKEAQLEIPIFPDDPIVGNKKAPMTIITFEDFACANCLTQHEILSELLEKYPEKFKIIWKMLPVTRFPYSSETAHLYAYCANRQQQFNQFREYAFANNSNLSPEIIKTISEQVKLDEKKLSTCLDSEAPGIYIENTKQLAKAFNIQSVPTFFIDNKQIQTPKDLFEWEILLGLNSL